MSMRRGVAPLRMAILVGTVIGPMADRAMAYEEFENELGYEWVIPPFEAKDGFDDEQLRSAKGAILMAEKGQRGRLLVTIAGPGLMKGFASWRPVAFDRDGQRYNLDPVVRYVSRIPEETTSVALDRWYSDSKVLSIDQISRVGLEGLTMKAYRDKIEADARTAAAQAKEQGIEVLPFPIVGQPYSFRLNDASGNVIDSASTKGQIVVLDFWAMWCYPCVAKMPHLKELHKRWHGRGLEIIGVNFDKDAETGTANAAELGLPWKQTFPPADEETRELWKTASGVTSFPKLLVIDRQGILRSNCEPEELEEEIDRLISE